MEKLELISIIDLFEKDFFIPFYQRGYRWKERQVLDLLEDILEFQRKDKEKGEFYCLQPIVITKKDDDDWEVIDGQQRLTALYLILLYMDNLLKEDYFIDKTYTIKYETRPKSWEFLRGIKEQGIENKENADFYHISKTYLIIKNWFEEKIREQKITKRKFLEVLIDKNVIEIEGEKKDIANNVRFIWYEVETSNEKKAIEIFTRINMGKIPLTNAELIKALFFINGNLKEKEKHQFKIAHEWDNIEYSLQNKNFWFFLNKHNNSKPTKIEFIFDLIANKYVLEVDININKSIDKYYTFYIFNELIQNGRKTKDVLWDEIKTYFRTFYEWYNNNEYYHIIGYLIHTGSSIENIKELSDNKSKKEFRIELNRLIKNDIENYFKIRDIKEFIELDYNDHYDYINKILLLFNVISTMDSKYAKFPYERYISEKWSLEHIHAQNSEDFKTDKQRRLILKEQKIFFNKSKDEEILIKINDLLEALKIEEDDFKELQDEVFRKYSDKISIHSIDNMALLSKDDNSALNNNIFPIKRDKIKELDEKGSFIPICTKNVFLKYYSKNVEQNVKWDKDDRLAYLEEIKETLKNYLPKFKRVADEN